MFKSFLKVFFEKIEKYFVKVLLFPAFLKIFSKTGRKETCGDSKKSLSILLDPYQFFRGKFP